jgi:lipopolysaccharide/colanic/teichoic acid biosynthesis glycosyltransferase
LPRAADIAIAAIGVVVLSPLMLVCAIAIKLDSRGPVLYSQVRVGMDGRLFTLLKLRTFHHQSDADETWAPLQSDDPRITRVGSRLRRLSLDEVPNLVNVLRGDMAIVGPRPTIPDQVREYTAFQRRRLEVRPGLTGWAQVNGRAAVSWDERIQRDVWYIDNRSIRLDLLVLRHTALQVLRNRELTEG